MDFGVVKGSLDVYEVVVLDDWDCFVELFDVDGMFFEVEVLDGCIMLFFLVGKRLCCF